MSHSDIHKHFAISFQVPIYELDMGNEKRVAVAVQLRRPSDGCHSEAVIFYYTSDREYEDSSSMVEVAKEFRVSNDQSYLSSSASTYSFSSSSSSPIVAI